MKILCICPIGIGNYLLCYPAWSILHRRIPEAELHILALRKPITELAAGDPVWNKIHFIDPTKKNNISKIINFLYLLKKEKYDVSLSFFPSNTWQYNLLPFIAGVKRRIAFRYCLKRKSSLSWLNSEAVTVDTTLHDIRQNINLVSWFLKQDLSDEKIVFPSLFTENEAALADKILGNDATGYFAVHPGSSKEHGMDAKRWPAERFGALADRISEYLNAKAVIIGGNDESDLKNAVAASMKHPYRIIAPQSLKVTAAILSRCKICLCNDSGIMHLAGCMRVPVVAIFGPTDETRNGPWGERNCIIRKNMEGFPVWTAANVGCRKLPMGIDANASLTSLTVDEAWETMKDFLHRISSF